MTAPAAMVKSGVTTTPMWNVMLAVVWKSCEAADSVMPPVTVATKSPAFGDMQDRVAV